MKNFTFYDLYWKLIKNESDKTAGRFIRNACEYMFEGKQISEPTDNKEAFIWTTAEEFLCKTKEIEASGKTPKTFNKKMAHFAFEDNYYKAIKLMTEEESGAYIKALCGYMFDGIEPKKLKPPVDSFYDIAKIRLELSKVRINSGRKGGQAERGPLTEKYITSKTPQEEWGLTFAQFMKRHPNIKNDMYVSNKGLLNGVDWLYLDMCLRQNKQYKESTSLLEILTHRNEIENVDIGMGNE